MITLRYIFYRGNEYSNRSERHYARSSWIRNKSAARSQLTKQVNACNPEVWRIESRSADHAVLHSNAGISMYLDVLY